MDNFVDMYYKFEAMYNKFPVCMSRAEAFNCALSDGLITNKQFDEARKYFGNLWFYVGD